MPFDMGRQIGLSAGDFGGGGVAAVRQASHPVTDLSPHVDGGQSSSAMTNASANSDETRQMYLCAIIVLSALAALWLLGALVFRRIRL